ncbi:hypothetical protein KEC55_32720 [Burkholderia cepacia]|uniref:glycosyl hydrolase family 28-related protein n=1 Tax=Burkholderia cepacia TaxID=292 RepID=UPI00249F1B12|nr:glycosyl hydrolase family 28-related protein [Burkholderia cepacia]WGY73528.1 hypothetical protein KEC55_32720 [Burkholderia cepacia]
MKKYGSTAAIAVLTCAGLMSSVSYAHSQPDFGKNVYVFDKNTPVAKIKSTLDSISAAQVSNQFGPQRYAVLFMPGTYGSASEPLNFQVGYYTSIAGLGRSPTDVTVNGSINSYNICGNGNCTALSNFWRSVSNLSISVNNSAAGCQSGEFWAVSQAAPLRRVSVDKGITLMDYCSQPSYASGGFIADSIFGGSVLSGSQQQWYLRNSSLNGWSNGVWNQVFSGVTGAPATCFPGQSSCGGPYTTLDTTPVVREAPYLYVDDKGRYRVFRPALTRNAAGPTWSANHATPGTSVSIDDFYIAKPTDDVDTINRALDRGENLLLTPGVYLLDSAIRIRRPDTIVLGLGFPTLIPQRGTPAMVADAELGVVISGLLLDAGPKTSPTLLALGSNRQNGGGYGYDRSSRSSALNPTSVHDVFVRVGGAAAGSVTNAITVNSDNAILDDLWIWRADHGAGAGWTTNPSATGLLVNGDNVVALGLAVEHFQKDQVVWNGQNGTVIFFQSELPYDPPSQAAWMSAPGVRGYPALHVTDRVWSFAGYGMGAYSNFNLGVNIFSDNAFVVPRHLAPGSVQDVLSVFLAGSGGIANVIDDKGGPATPANAATPVSVTHFP